MLVPAPRRLAAALGGKATQHLSAAVVSLLALSSGMSLGWTSAAAEVEFGGQGFSLTTGEWSWVGAAMTLGAMVGSLLVGVLLRPLGPRTACLGMAPIFCAGWALHAWAINVWMMVLGRTLVGLCFGATCVVVPIFTSEIGESAVRGALGSYLELFVCVGVLIVYLLGAYLPLMELNVCCMAVPAFFALLFFWMPDSPRWLLGRPGRREEARQALAFYRGANADMDAVDAELHEMEVAMKAHAEEERDVSLASAFSSRATRRGMGLAVIAMVLQQVSGIDGVTFYASQMFRDAGTLTLSADEASMVMVTSEIVFCLVALLVVDRLGRRLLLMASAGIMGLCCFAMGFYFYLNSGEDRDHSLDWVPVLVSCIYMMGFAFGLGPVAWLYVGEIFPDRVKGVASSVANASNWMCAFLVTKFFPIINETWGVQVSFWGFGASCLVGMLAVALLFPETKGKTLDQIQDELSGEAKKERPEDAENKPRRRYGSFDESSASASAERH